MTEKIDAGADHGILEALPYLGYKTHSALAEYIDNSVQSYFDKKAQLKALSKNYKLKIHIFVSKNKRVISIRDNAGGISDKDWSRALKTAAKPVKPKKGSLNEFGMGMKCASYWFTRQWSIETKALNEKAIKTVNLDLGKISNSNDGKVIVHRDFSKPNTKSFTKITLKNCEKPIGKHKEFVESLESVFRNFLGNDIEIYYEAEGSKDFSNPPYKLSFKKPVFRNSYPITAYKSWLDNYHGNYKSEKAKKYKPKPVLWKLPINIKFGVEKNEDKFTAKGYVAKLETSFKGRGLYYFRYNKLLQGPTFPESIISSMDSSHLNKGLYGEIHFSNVDSTFTKDELVLNDDDLHDFEEKLQKEMQDPNKFDGNSLWEQLRTEIKKEVDKLIEKEKLLAKGIHPDIISQNEKRSFSYSQQIKAVKNGKKYKDLNRSPEDPVSMGHKRAITINKDKSILIGGTRYKVVVKTTWDEDYFDSWLQYQINKKTKTLTIQIALSHVFFTQYFLNAATNEDGKSLIRDGIVIFAEFLITSTIIAASDMGVTKAETILNNLNSILRELPPSENRRNLS